MAHLALPNSALRVGIDFGDDPVVRAALAGAAPVCVLFPRPGAMDVSELAKHPALTLVVLDGTWWQARKLLQLNPVLAALPRVAFAPRRPSEYRIRQQPAEHCVSTIEALAEVLTRLEPEAGPFDRLLDPFRLMVDRQQWFETEVRARRHRRPRRERAAPPAASSAQRLVADWTRIVCVQGEANAWSARDPDRQDPEIVHWVAHRPSTGETYERVIAPRGPLAPSTPAHIQLASERLHGGGTTEDWRRSWQAFAGPDDLLVHWGVYYTRLAARDGLPLPTRSFDLRRELSQMSRQRVGTIEQGLARLAVEAPVLAPQGRGGRRLAALVAMVTALAR